MHQARRIELCYNAATKWVIAYILHRDDYGIGVARQLAVADLRLFGKPHLEAIHNELEVRFGVGALRDLPVALQSLAAVERA